MAILSGNIKLLKSDTMSDAPEGGGAITGQVIIDGESNNIFDDISTMDRVYGAVHMRKVFPAVQTQTVDRYFGSHVIISKLPGDGKIGVNLFNTGDYFDRRPSAKSRVENYRARGPLYSGFLWATQYQGSRAIVIFQGETAAKPGIGDVLDLVTATTSQAVKITKMTDSVQTFSDGSGAYQRRILEIEISDVLAADFVGAQISRADPVSPAAVIYKTVVANAARYYSARPLAIPAVSGSLTIKTDSVYSQVVPSSQSELPLIDIGAGGDAIPLIESSSADVTISVANSGSTAILIFSRYLGSPITPGTLSIAMVAVGTLTDVAGSMMYNGIAYGTVIYATGELKFKFPANPMPSSALSCAFRPAAAPIRVADTTAIRVTAANRGYVWTINLNPPPKPGALSVSYRALNTWYELHDNSNGGLIAEEVGIGSGSVNYVTGSVTLTTAALPDADSDIIYAWGQAADFFNRSAITPGKVKVTHQLGQAGFDASTLTISWDDGNARTASVNAAGVVGGDATGQLNLTTGLLEFSPSALPLGGTDFAVAYNHGAAISKTLSEFNVAGNIVTLDLGDTNIIPGSLKIAWAAPWTADPQYTVPVSSGAIQQQDADDGAGALRGGRSSTIDYIAGTLTFDATINTTYKKADYSPSLLLAGVGGMSEGSVRTMTGYSDAGVQTSVPAAFSVTYRTASAGSSANETLTLSTIKLDLTPGYAEAIVAGSVRFALGSRTYVDRNGQLYYDIDPVTGAGTYAGTVDYSAGDCLVTAWAPLASADVTLQSLLTTMNFQPIEFAIGRTPAAPVKVGVFQIRATPADGGGQISATAASNGDISSGDIEGFIEYETGVWRVRFGQLVTAAGHEAEPWFDPDAVVGGNIFKPRFVYADTIVYSTVAYTYLPLSSAILGLDPVRLPSDGRVPVYAPGDVVVILNDQTTVGTFTSGQVINLGADRVRIAKLTVKDAAGNPLAVAKYLADLDTGAITFGDLNGISQPLTIVDRIEDMAVLSDVQITGTLSLSKPISHNFPVAGTLVSNAIVYGTIYARTSVPFTQQTWTNVWSDVRIGSSIAAQYNNTQYPIIVDNASTIQERWVVVFTSASAFTVTGEHIGQIISSGSTATLTAPINPNTGQPYFSIPESGWGTGWASGNVMRFNTYSSNVPTWVIQAIAQGEATNDDYTFALEFRGDINA